MEKSYVKNIAFIIPTDHSAFDVIVDVENILINHFNGATLQESLGFFNRKKERSLIITIINCCGWEEPIEIFREKINIFVKQLRHEPGQESILVEHTSKGNTQIFEVLE